MQQLTDGGLITAEQAAQLTELGEASQPDLKLLADHLAGEVERLIGGPDDGDGEGAPLPEVTDDTLAASVCACDAHDAIRAELTRRTADRTAVLARIRPAGAGDPPATPPSRPAAPGARLGRVVARGGQPRPDGGQVREVLTAAGGAPVHGDRALLDLIGEAARSAAGPSGGSWSGRRLIASAATTFPEERTLGADPNVNAARIAAAVSPAALTASGGLCAPVAVMYQQAVFSSPARPIRDNALGRFGADRGGVRLLTPPTLADVSPGTGIWTNADDVAATGTKATVTLDCPTETEVLVQAIYASLTVGNFRARFFGEQVEAGMTQLAAAAARLAETELWDAIVAGSLAVTAPEVVSSTRDVLGTVDRAVASLRARMRLPETQPMTLIGPSWFRDMVRADLSKEIPGAPYERLAVADEELARWLAVRQVSATWSPDVDISWAQTQTAGPLVAFPTTGKFALFPFGTWVHLDGGSLDLGMIRDSTLTSTNDLMFFSETFENAAMVGGESLVLSVALDPTGATSGTVDLNPSGP